MSLVILVVVLARTQTSDSYIDILAAAQRN